MILDFLSARSASETNKTRIERTDSWHRAKLGFKEASMTSEDNLIICQTIKLFDDISFLRQLRSVLYVLRAGAIETFLTERERAERKIIN